MEERGIISLLTQVCTEVYEQADRVAEMLRNDLFLLNSALRGKQNDKRRCWLALVIQWLLSRLHALTFEDAAEFCHETMSMISTSESLLRKQFE